jgi:hypothetical protein
LENIVKAAIYIAVQKNVKGNIALVLKGTLPADGYLKKDVVLIGEVGDYNIYCYRTKKV